MCIHFWRDVCERKGSYYNRWIEWNGKRNGDSFCKEGARVVITGRTKEKLEETKLEIEQFRQVLPVQMDVRNTDDIQKMIEQIDEKFGRIDVLINNAAGNFICPAEDLSVNGWNSVINIVLNGTFYCSHAVGKYWIEKGIKGNIINMVATYAWDAGPELFIRLQRRQEY